VLISGFRDRQPVRNVEPSSRMPLLYARPVVSSGPNLHSYRSRDGEWDPPKHCKFYDILEHFTGAHPLRDSFHSLWALPWSIIFLSNFEAFVQGVPKLWSLISRVLFSKFSVLKLVRMIQKILRNRRYTLDICVKSIMGKVSSQNILTFVKRVSPLTIS